MTTTSASWECVVCMAWMVEEGRRPLVQTCKCRTRICQACLPHVPRCPTCRADSLQKTIDVMYEREMRLEVRGVQCPGCFRNVLSRHISAHVDKCVPFLHRRLKEVNMDVEIQQEQYRNVADENERLMMRIHELAYHVAYFNQARAPRAATVQPPAHARTTRATLRRPPTVVVVDSSSSSSTSASDSETESEDDESL